MVSKLLTVHRSIPCRVVDCILGQNACEGCEILIKVALKIFDKLQDRICALHGNFEGILKVIKNEPRKWDRPFLCALLTQAFDSDRPTSIQCNQSFSVVPQGSVPPSREVPRPGADQTVADQGPSRYSLVDANLLARVVTGKGTENAAADGGVAHQSAGD